MECDWCHFIYFIFAGLTMFFNKKERGYTPWAPRKAPMFNSSLNATYIKLPAALIFSSVLFIAGVISSPMIMSRVQINLGLFTAKTKPVAAAPVAKVAPVAKAPVSVIAQAPITEPEASEFIVPAIPMATETVKAPVVTAEEILKRDFDISTYDALTYIGAAKSASSKTGIEPSLLLAIAAKTTKFKLFNAKKFIGVMNIKPELYQKEVQKLKLENISYSTVDGSFRLGAEVLLSFFNESNGDMYSALNKFISTNKSPEQPTLAEILELKKQFEGI